MTTDLLLSEIERQQKYLNRLPSDFTFPLFNAKYAVESQRKSGYRDTAAASREIVDNSIEAGADWVHVVFETSQSSTRRIVTAIAFIDNGSGMLPEMARYALSWGGGTHFDEPEFIGKFGFGLPNASINQTRRVEVYTRIEPDEEWTKAYLDISRVAEHGLQTIDPPVKSELPSFVENYIRRTGSVVGHGTVVVWVDPDRLTYKTPGPLKQHILEDFGVTYRYLLARGDRPLDLVVEGVKVQPVDPLFQMPEARYYLPPEEGGATVIAERLLPVSYYFDTDTGERHLKKAESDQDLDRNAPDLLAIGTIYIKIVRFPLDFALGTTKAGEEKTDAHRRFDIRKTRRGMAFVRSGREIETFDAFPRSVHDEQSGLGQWPLLQSYAYHWGVEVRFSPELDEVFGITNDKQEVHPIEDFWRILAKEGIDDLLNAENTWQEKQRHDRKFELRKAQPSETATPAESAARSADAAGTSKPEVPDHSLDRAKKNLDDAARERAKITDGDLDEAKKALEQERKRRPYKIDYFDAEYGPFYRAEWVGPQIVVKINRKHPFYTVFYDALLRMDNGGLAKDGIDLLLITLGKAELVARNQELSLWYETQREQVWSPFLGTSMKSLGQSLDESEESLVTEVEA